MTRYYEEHKHDAPSVASLVYFNAGVSLEEAQAAIDELVKKGLVSSHTTRDYIEAFGSPVWYVP